MAFELFSTDPNSTFPFISIGTPFDTPHGVSNAGSVTDLKATVAAEDDEDLEAGPQLYVTEGTPGCFSRADSDEELETLHRIVGSDENLGRMENNENRLLRGQCRGQDDLEDEENIEKGQKEAAEGGPKEKNSLEAGEVRTPLPEVNMTSSDGAGMMN